MTRTGDLSQSLTVTLDFDSLDPTAEFWTDYYLSLDYYNQGRSGWSALDEPLTVTFAADEDSIPLWVIPVDDDRFEPDELVALLVSEGDGYQAGSGTATVTIRENGANHRPRPEKTAVTTAEDTAVDIQLEATDPDDDELTYSIFRQPEYGTVTVEDDVATYTPDEGFVGWDEFLFQANDGELDSNLGVVRVHVDPYPVVPSSAGPAIVADASQVEVGESVAFTVYDPWAEWDFDFDGVNFAPTAWGEWVGHTFVGPGTYTVAVGVYDEYGELALSTTQVTVTDVENVVVLPPIDVWAAEGESIAFDAPPGWLDLIGQPDDRATVDPGSAEWDFGDESAPGAGLAPTHLYDPGEYIATVTLTDDQGNTGSAVVNVWVEALPPDVSAGTDQTVDAGTPVTFSGTASDHSGIETIEWDFDFDGLTFLAEPTATGDLTPTFEFYDAGIYWVALRAVANDGLETIDVITVTVANEEPEGNVTLALTRPDGSAQVLTEGSAVYFAVSGLLDTDPTEAPSVWADWHGDGTWELIPEEEWLSVTTAEDGSKSFLVGHLYDDNRTYPAAFEVVDAEGEVTPSSVPVTVAGVAPTGTFALKAPSTDIDPGQPVTLSFSGVTDPSTIDTEFGFTYSYRVDNGEWQESDSPDLVLQNLQPGTTHTVEATVADWDGEKSSVSTQTFRVLSDRVFRNDGAGAVRLNWPSGSTQLGGGQAYRFPEQITWLGVDLLTPGATYNLATYFQIDQMNGGGLSGVQLTVSTDRTAGMPPFVGGGHIGPVTVGDNSFLWASARGDFAGMVSPNSTAVSLSFRN